MNIKKTMAVSLALSVSVALAHGMATGSAENSTTVEASAVEAGGQYVSDGSPVSGEQYERMLTDDKWWIIESGYYGGDLLIKVTVSRDTVVNGLDAKVLRHVVVDEDYNEIIPSPDQSYPQEQVWREENGIVYMLVDDVFLPQMDFSVQTGDRVRMYETDGTPMEAYLDVVWARELTIRGVREWVVRLMEGMEPAPIWISGVGSPDFFYMTNWPLPSSGYYPEIRKCFKGDECIYSAEDYAMIVESGVGELPDDVSPEGGRHYNLQGIPVSDPRRGEVYILRTASGSRKVIF